MPVLIGGDQYGLIALSEDGLLAYRVTFCCWAVPRGTYQHTRDGDIPVVKCTACGLLQPDHATDAVPQPVGSPCTCVPMPPGFPIVPGRSTCGQHGDHVPTEDPS